MTPSEREVYWKGGIFLNYRKVTDRIDMRHVVDKVAFSEVDCELWFLKGVVKKLVKVGVVLINKN